MIGDFAGCWLVEVACKWLFADLAPKPIVTRGRERREARRAEETRAKQEKERLEKERIEAENLRQFEKELAKESRKSR
jgi:cation-transporting ATPase 13A1